MTDQELRDQFALNAPDRPYHGWRPVIRPEPEMNYQGAARTPQELFDHQREHAEWQAELYAQTAVQWPYAWADMQMKERARTR